MSEIVESLDGNERARIESLRKEKQFFWVDISLDETSHDQLAEVLGLPDHALRPLLDFSPTTQPSRKFHADGEHVVFPFNCFFASDKVEQAEGGQLVPIEVHVLVHGDYLLTVHRERVELPALLAGYTPEKRSEQYVVYAVLDAMVGTGFDALTDIELAMEGLQVMSTDTGSARVRMATLRAINVRLSTMRRQVGPQRGIFERVSQEIGQVEGLQSDNERYFERVYGQLNRLIDGIDAAAMSMATLIDLRLNETMYWLTVVATIFLPLTFVTGFFGMNFDWMVTRIDTMAAFTLLGIGGPIVGAFLTYFMIRKRGRPVAPDQDAVETLLKTVRRPHQEVPALINSFGSRKTN